MINIVYCEIAKYGQTHSYIILDKSPLKPISKESVFGNADQHGEQT